MLLSRLLPAAARIRPDSAAVTCCGATLTYSQLNARVGRLAAGYLAHGLRPGDRVALLGRHCHRVGEASLAAFAIGALPFGVNAKLPGKDLTAVVADGDPALLVYSSEHASTATEVRMAAPALRSLVSIDEGGDHPSTDDLIQQFTPPVEPAVTDPGEAALIVYTGGTTGRPKGVVHSHRSFAANMITQPLWYANEGWEESQLIGGGPVHLSGHASLMRAVMRGWRAVYPSLGRGLAEQIVTEHVTRAGLIGSVFRDTIDRVLGGSDPVRGMRYISQASAATNPGTWTRAVEAFPNATVVEFYATTEAGYVTGIDHGRAIREGANPEWLMSVGFPRGSHEVRIVDDESCDLPHGEVGEIIVRGAPTMMGYWRNPPATADVVRNGWLHTGDLGRIASDGHLYLVDRKKDMIVANDENVYSAEVEFAIASHPAVRECAVVGAPLGDEGEQVVAIVALRGETTLTLDALRAHCALTLSEFELPAKLERVAALPRTPMGKVDKPALRARYWMGRTRAIN